jgi:hypothetical protein
MGARQATWAVLAAVCLLPARVGASVQMEPVARLALEGGYDSNVAFEGKGGEMGRVSPDLGLQFRDHTWELRTVYGLDLFHYAARDQQNVVNQRGEVGLDLDFTERTTLTLDGDVAYALDPIAVARLGYVVPEGESLVWSGDAKLAWRSTPRVTLAATYRERAARFDGTGVALHAPGGEVGWRLDERTEFGALYRFDRFQRIGDTPDPGRAHETLAFGRWRWTRRLRLEAEAGPAFWSDSADSAVVPVVGVTLHASGRPGDLRVTARHGIGINQLARSSLTDNLEAGFAWRLARSFVLRGDGGFWHGGVLPDGDGATTGYGLSTEFAWIARRGLEIGIGASRYARLDTTSSELERNTVGLRVGWVHETH